MRYFRWFARMWHFWMSEVPEKYAKAAVARMSLGGDLLRLVIQLEIQKQKQSERMRTRKWIERN